MTVTLFAPLTKPIAAQLNAIGASQTTLNAVYRGTAIELMQQEKVTEDLDIWLLHHQYRWLLYNSQSTLEDPAGVNEPVTLTDPETGWGLKDLDEIEWLTVGMFYRVSGGDYAYERREPPSA